MRNFWLVVATLIFSFSSASKAAQEFSPPRFIKVSPSSPIFAIALKNVKKTLLEPRTPLAFDNGTFADNCASYSNLSNTSTPEESIRNKEIHSEYLICEALILVSSDSYIIDKHAALPSNTAKEFFERLDLRSFPSSLNNRADDQRHTLKTLMESSTIKISEDSIEIESDEQFFSLKIIGTLSRATLNNGVKSAQKEWIVWIGDERKDGNYKSYSTVVVRPPTPSSRGRYTGSIYPAPATQR